MLGEKIVQVKGKVIGQRVIDAEGPTTETTVSQSGNAKEIPVNETVTFVGKPTSSPGVLFAKGNGILMAAEEAAEMVMFTAEAVGRLAASGSTSFRGSHFYRTLSTGKLGFLNNVMGCFEAGISADGNVAKTVWEWR